MDKYRLLPKVLVNSVPKSGTNLLLQIVKGIPGIEQKQNIFYHSGNYEKAYLLENGEVISSHIPYIDVFQEKLTELNIKHLFIYRDLRDVAVSMRHFIHDKLHHHPFYPLFQTRLQTKDEQLMALIKGANFLDGEHPSGLTFYPGVYDEYKQIYEWVKQPNVCIVRFENLVKNEQSKTEEIWKIVQFLWEDIKYLGFSKMQLVRKMKKNINPKKSFTFRKGAIGDWRLEFTEAHKQEFKKLAGQLLIDLHYEKDLDW